MQNLKAVGRQLGMAAVLVLVGACSRDPHSAMLKYVKSGDEYMAAGKVPEAIVQYRNAIEKEPQAGDPHVKLAEAYVKNGDLAKGAQQYVRAADLVTTPDVQLKAGSLMLLARRFDDAKVRAQKVLGSDPRNVEAQILLANSLAGLKDLDGAVSELQEAIQLHPEHSPTFSSLGQIELGRGHHAAAEAAFLRAVELAPQSAPARMALGGFYWATGRVALAEAELTHALKAEPANPLAHRAAAVFYLATNRRDRAEPHLRRVVELTKSADASLVLADYYVAMKNEAAAREVLQPLTQGPKSSTLASVRLAALDRFAGQSEEAYRKLDGVLKADPGNLQAQLLRGSFLLEDGKRDDALAIANAALEAHRDSVGAYALLGRVQSARRQPEAAIAAYQEIVRLNPLATDAKVALARLQLAFGRAESSVGMAEDALKAQPRNPDAQLVLVQALLVRGDLDRAAQELAGLKTRFPDSAAVRVQLGILAGRRRQPDEARAEFERALKLQPQSLEAIGGLVALDLSLRRVDEARKRVDELVNRPGVRPAALMLAARTYAGTGDLDTAERHLRQVLATDPSYLAAYGLLGQLYARQRKLDAAVAEFEALAQRQPKPVAALTMIGMIRESQGDRARAQQTFERVMQLDPEAAVAANNLAWIYSESGGNLDVALQLAQTAKRRLPETPEVNDTLGYIYYKKDLPALAIPPLQASVQKDPNNPLFHYHLGLAYRKAGNSVQARESLNRALMLKPDFSGAQDARNVLESLKGGAS
jgi:tetratricopeptide (TPR) repeat protein